MEKEVQAGMDLLGMHDPGWNARINLDTLDVASPSRCVLGQAFGSYAEGLRELDIEEGEQYGFTVSKYDLRLYGRDVYRLDRGDEHILFQRLTSTWKQMIMQTMTDEEREAQRQKTEQERSVRSGFIDRVLHLSDPTPMYMQTTHGYRSPGEFSQPHQYTITGFAVSVDEAEQAEWEAEYIQLALDIAEAMQVPVSMLGVGIVARVNEVEVLDSAGTGIEERELALV